jgi:hypothetical protein
MTGVILARVSSVVIPATVSSGRQWKHQAAERLLASARMALAVTYGERFSSFDPL